MKLIARFVNIVLTRLQRLLLPFPSLWPNEMRFDVTKTMIDSKCDEVDQSFLCIVSLLNYQAIGDVSLP
jgi:hypothetical protein